MYQMFGCLHFITCSLRLHFCNICCDGMKAVARLVQNTSPKPWQSTVLGINKASLMHSSRHCHDSVGTAVIISTNRDVNLSYSSWPTCHISYQTSNREYQTTHWQYKTTHIYISNQVLSHSPCLGCMTVLHFLIEFGKDWDRRAVDLSSPQEIRLIQDQAAHQEESFVHYLLWLRVQNIF